MTLPQHMLRSTAYDLAEALDVNELYQQKGWTDGLPIVPPTEKRVIKCLQAVEVLSVVCRSAHGPDRHPPGRANHPLGPLPMELLEKLAALVPLPQVYLVRSGGCLAPHSHLRGAIISAPCQLRSPLTPPMGGES